jgi:hypothetical protein
VSYLHATNTLTAERGVPARPKETKWKVDRSLTDLNKQSFGDEADMNCFLAKYRDEVEGQKPVVSIEFGVP